MCFLYFRSDGDVTWPPHQLGVWRSHFQARTETEDPGGYANASTNTSFLVRDPSDITVGSSGKFVVTVGVNEIVTVTTQVQGVPVSFTSNPPCL